MEVSSKTNTRIDASEERGIDNVREINKFVSGHKSIHINRKVSQKLQYMK